MTSKLNTSILNDESGDDTSTTIEECISCEWKRKTIEDCSLCNDKRKAEDRSSGGKKRRKKKRTYPGIYTHICIYIVSSSLNLS